MYRIVEKLSVRGLRILNPSPIFNQQVNCCDVALKLLIAEKYSKTKTSRLIDTDP
jgi:hypothetical protein